MNKAREIEGLLNRKQIIFITTVICALLALVVGSYLLNFGIGFGHISNSTDDWSNYGSYIGGLLGTILGGFNLWLLISLNSRVFSQNDMHHREIINNQKMEELYDSISNLNVCLHHSCNRDVEGNSNLCWIGDEISKYVDSHEKIQMIIYLYFRNKDFVKMLAFLERLSLILTNDNNIQGISLKNFLIRKKLDDYISTTLLRYRVELAKINKTNTLSIDEFDHLLEVERASFTDKLPFLEELIIPKK